MQFFKTDALLSYVVIHLRVAEAVDSFTSMQRQLLAHRSALGQQDNCPWMSAENAYVCRYFAKRFRKSVLS